MATFTSSHGVGDSVSVLFPCPLVGEVVAVIFENGKVFYDISVNVTGDLSTTLARVDSAFVS